MRMIIFLWIEQGRDKTFSEILLLISLAKWRKKGYLQGPLLWKLFDAAMLEVFADREPSPAHKSFILRHPIIGFIEGEAKVTYYDINYTEGIEET